MNSLFSKNISGRSTILNGWLSVPSPFIAEAMARQGWGSITVDMQHGLIDFHQTALMLQATSTVNATTLVRVPWAEPSVIMKVLDAGANGVICPMINTVDEAATFVKSSMYSPKGYRSFGPLRANLVYGASYWQSADENITRLAMIETASALDNLDDILNVEGLTGVYIGPSDLSLSMGCQPKFDDVEAPVQQAIEHILETTHSHGLKAGIHCSSIQSAKSRAKLGFDLVTSMSDLRFIVDGSNSLLKEWNEAAHSDTQRLSGY